MHMKKRCSFFKKMFSKNRKKIGKEAQNDAI